MIFCHFRYDFALYRQHVKNRNQNSILQTKMLILRYLVYLLLC